jgi:hypothetical protein
MRPPPLVGRGRGRGPGDYSSYYYLCAVLWLSFRWKRQHRTVVIYLFTIIIIKTS